MKRVMLEEVLLPEFLSPTYWELGAWALCWLIRTRMVSLILGLGSSTFPGTGDTWFDGVLYIHYNLGTEISALQEKAERFLLGFRLFPVFGVKEGSPRGSHLKLGNA